RPRELREDATPDNVEAHRHGTAAQLHELADGRVELFDGPLAEQDLVVGGRCATLHDGWLDTAPETPDADDVYARPAGVDAQDGGGSHGVERRVGGQAVGHVEQWR